MTLNQSCYFLACGESAVALSLVLKWLDILDQIFCSTGLPLAKTRWIRSTFSIHCPLSSNQCHWLTLATLIMFHLNFLGNAVIEPRAAVWESSMLPLCLPPPTRFCLLDVIIECASHLSFLPTIKVAFNNHITESMSFPLAQDIVLPILNQNDLSGTAAALSALAERFTSIPVRISSYCLKLL